jgi:hypothetical protein
MTHTPKQVHRLLDRYFAGALEAEQVHQWASEWLTHPAGVALTQGRTEEALAALSEILSEPTERQVLIKILQDGLATHRNVARQVFGPVHFPPLEALFAKHSRSKPAFHMVDIRRLSGCPACNVDLTWVRPDGYRELERDIGWRLRQLGFAKCPRGDYLLAKEVS